MLRCAGSAVRACQREKVAGLITLALIAPEPRHAHRGAEFTEAALTHCHRES